jgi:molecular chaperone DnaK
MGGVMTKLIERNTTIPTKRQQVFSTAADSQPQVEIRVLQGEREMAADNRELGRFILDGIPPAPRGVPQIEVTFDIDANGILSVGAKDKATGKEQSIRIEGSGGLDQAEVERMVKDAEAHASEDHARRERIEKKNQLDSMVYQAEKTVADSGENIPVGDKNEIDDALANAKKALEGDDDAAIDAARQRLEGALHKVAEHLYKQQADAGAAGAGGPEAAGGSAGGGGSDDDDVIDAEYTEEK